MTFRVAGKYFARKMSYAVYMVTNRTRSVLYVGVTNDLYQRICEHYFERGKPKTFAGKYHCHHLVFHESYKYVKSALAREKEIKGWTRAKKNELIQSLNPKWSTFECRSVS